MTLPATPRRSVGRCCSPSAPPTRPSRRPSPRPSASSPPPTRRPPRPSTPRARCRPACSRRRAPRPGRCPRSSARPPRARSKALVARRDFLESDVDQLEHFLVEQRDRLRQAASALLDISERVPGGLGDVRRPLLSASDESGARPRVALTGPPRRARRSAESGPRCHARRDCRAVSCPATRSKAPTTPTATTPTARRVDDPPGRSGADDESVVTTPWAAEPDDEPTIPLRTRRNPPLRVEVRIAR